MTLMNVTYQTEDINWAKILVIRLRFRLQVTAKNEKRMNKYRKKSLVDHVFEEVLIYKHGKITLMRKSSMPRGSRESLLTFLGLTLHKIELKSFLCPYRLHHW